MMVSTLAHDDYVGRIAIGRVEPEPLKKGQNVVLCRLDGSQVSLMDIKLWIFQGLKRIEVTEVEAGDIAASSGIEALPIGETIADALGPQRFPHQSRGVPPYLLRSKSTTARFPARMDNTLRSRHLRDRLYGKLKKT
jgi:GTP-binding protein